MSGFREVEVNHRAVFQLDLEQIGMGTREDYQKTLEAAAAFLERKPPNSVLSLTRIHQYLLTEQVKTDIKAFIRHNQVYVRKSAVIGIDGLTQIALNTYNRIFRRNMKVFKTEAEALEWLTRE